MKGRQRHLQPPSANTRRGFALVVVSLLMVVLGILCLGMLTLSAVEIRQNQHGGALSEARANARIGLMLALNELQKELGPDQRVSAPGGQLLPAGAKSPGTVWLGVYDSWKFTNETEDSDPLRRPAPTFRRWLISGEDSVVRQRDSAIAGQIDSEADKRVTLVPEVLAPGSPMPAVEAGLVKIEGGSTAWWVADQSMKAKLGDPAIPPTDATQAANRLQSSPRVDHQTFSPALADETDPGIAKLVSTGSTKFLDPDSGSLIHDATVTSTGVFANVRKGGLKKDLSFLLERPWTEVKADPRMGPLYSSGAKGGISLKELWAYYNIWGELKESPPTHADGSSFPAGVKYLEHPPGANAARKDPFFAYKSLTPLEARFALSFVSEKVGSDPASDDYHLHFITDPIYTVWNPFNVAYSLPQAGFNDLNFYGLLYRLHIEVTASDGTRRSHYKNINDNGFVNKNWGRFLVGKAQPLVMRPGEVQVLGEAPGASLKLGALKNNIDAHLGYSFGAGISRVVSYPRGKNDPGFDPSVTNDTPLVFQGNETLRIGFEPINERTGGGSTGPLSVGHMVIGVGATTGGADANNLYGARWSLNELRLPHIENRLDPTSVPEVIPSLPVTASSPSRKVNDIAFVSEATNASEVKWTQAIMSLGIATESDTEFLASGATGRRMPGKPFMNFNPKMQMMDLDQLTEEMHRLYPLQIGMRRQTSSNSIISATDKGLGFYGNDRSTLNGTSHIVTHALPFKPIHSLGAFQNSIANGLEMLEIGAFSGSDPENKDDFLAPGIAHAIGNSFAPGILHKTEVTGTVGPYPVADHSYLANQKLWDDYFFSSISPLTTTAQKNATKSQTERKTALTAFLETDPTKRKNLPNENILPYLGGPGDPLTELFPASATGSTEPFQKSASYLMIDGAFNVNSTSVPAWTALLKGLKNADVPTLGTTQPVAEPVLKKAVGTPFSGLVMPAGAQVDEATMSAPETPEQWNGFRALDDTEINNLASAIVAQVKSRGPFLSMADFVNRRPGSDTNKAVEGALQAAIRAIDANAQLATGTRVTPTAESDTYKFKEAQQGSRARGIPGFLKQGDILTGLGSRLTVRGDTFLIRAYGEAYDSEENITARAWCEATVQREPGYVDPIDSPHMDTASLTSNRNRTLGRKFRVISFRYLSPQEITGTL